MAALLSPSVSSRAILLSLAIITGCTAKTSEKPNVNAKGFTGVFAVHKQYAHMPSVQQPAKNIVLASSVTLPPVADKNTTPDDGSISLEDAIRRALQQNPERQIAAAQVDQATAGIDEAKSGYYPQANIKADAGREYNDPFSVLQGATTRDGYSYGNSTSLNVRQMLYDGFITREAVAQRLAQTQSANFNHTKITEELIKNTIQIYLQLAQFQRISVAATKNYDALQDIARLVDLRAEAGDTSVSEKNYIKARLANAEQEKINAYSAVKDAFSALRYLVGDIDDFMAEVPNLPNEDLPADVDGVLKKATRNNTDILLNQADKEAASHELNSVKGQFRPNISFVVDGSQAEDLGGETGIKRAASGRVELNYKLFDGGLRSASVQRQMGKIKEVDARGDRIRRELKQNVMQAFNKLNSAAKEQAVAAREIEANAELERVYIAQFKHGDGDVDVTNLVEARERIFSSSVKKARLESDTINAYYALKQLVGELTTPFCGKVCK